MAVLSFHTYGKTRVRLLQVLRSGDYDEVVEITVKILLQGDFAESYVAGDNSRVLPTDTMKNTVYVIARQKPIESIERFASDLGEHFLDRLQFLSAVSIEIAQKQWSRIERHAAAFVQNAKERRTVHLKLTRETRKFVCGLEGLQILKTRGSAFAGYLKDEYTTLAETQDRLLGTIVDARWVLLGGYDPNFNALHEQIRSTLLDIFATHESQSVQHTLYAMGEAVINNFAGVEEIHLTMPNKHFLPADLAKFGLDNPNRVFIPTDEPSGFIEARITR